MTTLKDLSKHLNLSVTQISRALNGYPDVSAKTRERVEAAAKALQYTPNSSAQKLVSGRSGIVGLIQKEYPGLSSDNGFMEVVIGLSAEFTRQGMQFILHVASGDEDELDSYRQLINGGIVDGFVLISPVVDDERMAFLRRHKIPFAVHGHIESKPDYAYFDINNFDVGYRLASLLMKAGHRNIVAVMGPRSNAHVRHRVRGIRQALREHGLAIKGKRIKYGLMTENLGFISTTQLFDTSSKPTAVIADNLLIAKGVYKSLDAMGYRIPQDISVVAHDDVRPTIHAESFSPALTTTRSPLSISWKPLVECLQGSIQNKPVKELQRILDIEMIERDSVRPILSSDQDPVKGVTH